MKFIVASALLMSFGVSAYANGNADLECTLDTGEVMTLSHVSSTVYIEFLGPDDDPDEGGRVIKLDVPSGGAQQTLGKSSTGESFVLRGTDDDIEGAVAVVYENGAGKKSAYFSLMNQLGNETGHHACVPDTIKAANTLLTAGLTGLKGENKTAQYATASPPSVPAKAPIKLSIDQELFQYGAVQTLYRTVNIVSIADNLIINSVVVNRNQCSESVGNPKKPMALPFGQTFTYKYNIGSRRCDVVEVVVNTNQGQWSLNP